MEPVNHNIVLSDCEYEYGIPQLTIEDSDSGGIHEHR